MQYSTAVAQVMKKETFSEDVDVLCQLATNQANKETEQSIVRQVVSARDSSDEAMQNDAKMKKHRT